MCIDGTALGGIIGGMGYEKQITIRRENYHFVAFNPKADYSINIPGLPDDVNKGLSDACRNVAETGSGERREVLNLVDLATGATVYSEIGEYDSIGGQAFWDFINNNPNGKYAFVHNHPTDSFLSSVDMQTFATTPQLQMMISTSNDGLKRIAHGNTDKITTAFEVLYSEEINQLRNKLKEGIIERVDYPFEFQKLIVECSLKDFANLGFWEVDGRV